MASNLPAPLGHGRLQDLLDENDELKERVRQLTDRLRGSNNERAIFVDGLRMTATEAILLGVLYHRPHPCKDDLYTAAWGDHDCPPDDGIVSTLICKMRPKLRRYGMEIKTVWGVGYEMDAPSKALLRQFLENWDLPRLAFPLCPTNQEPCGDCLEADG